MTLRKRQIFALTFLHHSLIEKSMTVDRAMS